MPPRNKQARTRDGRYRLTAPQVRLLQAWRQLRAHNPWQQPTMSELAHVLGITVSSVHRCVRHLVQQGVLVRTHQDNRIGRCYALTPEAAARPHLAELVRIVTEVVRLRPDKAHDGPGTESYAALWARSHAVVQEIVLLASRAQARSARMAAAEAEEDGETAGPVTPACDE